MLKKVILVLGILVTIALVYGYFTFYPQLPIANGYAAKKMCSCTFIAGRSQESIQKDDLGFGPLSLTKTVINKDSASVTTSLFGLAPRTAVYRHELGCILLDGADDYGLELDLKRPELPDTLNWPLGSATSYDQLPEYVDQDRLKAAIAGAFDPGYKLDTQKTRAVLVVYKGQLIGEQYSKGYDQDTELLGWSMAKSLTSTLIGILVKNGQLTLGDDRLFPEWTDKRQEITLQDLLQMQSGLKFSEEYGSISDATQMLFTVEDITTIPKARPLIHDPGTHWAYSSGTTNLLSGLLRNKINDHAAYLRLPYDSLFNRIGMNSAVLETDEAGTYIGSSYCYATPRDWARFGLLYLNYGNWFGDQLIDSSWVDFVRTPASDSKGIYGGQFWLNVGHAQFIDAPEDLYSCNGFQGQHVFIIPSRDLVIVRMGLAEWPQFDANKLIREILGSIAPPQ